MSASKTGVWMQEIPSVCMPVNDVTAWKTSKSEEPDSCSKCDSKQRLQQQWPSHQTKDRAGHDSVRNTVAAGEPRAVVFVTLQRSNDLRTF